MIENNGGSRASTASTLNGITTSRSNKNNNNFNVLNPLTANEKQPNCSKQIENLEINKKKEKISTDESDDFTPVKEHGNFFYFLFFRAIWKNLVKKRNK